MGAGASGIFEIGSTQNAHRRASRFEDFNLEVKPVSNVHRKHPVSIAVSMALLAAAATLAMAAERTGAPAENAGAQGAAQQDAPTTPSPDVSKAKPRTGSAEADERALETVTV